MFIKEDVFPEPKSVGPREWGEETMLFLKSGAYTFKLLKIRKGKKGGLQYHHLKDEAAYLVSGKLLIRYDLNDGVGLREKELEPGAVVRFPPRLVHQEEALTDVTLIEVSTPHLNDRVRVEDLYGGEISGGLPSTKIEEIETL